MQRVWSVPTEVSPGEISAEKYEMLTQKGDPKTPYATNDLDTPTNEKPVVTDGCPVESTMEIDSGVPCKGTEPYEVGQADSDDPWAIVTNQDDDGPSWQELNCMRKVLRVILVLAKVVLVVGMLYFFICSLDLLGSAFQLLGGRAAGGALGNSRLLNNPVCGLMIGVLATVLLQSSSTSTSITVTMVAAGIMNVHNAIPIIMGANIGTTVTNTIVALAHSSNRGEFRRAFGGATVHDMFNWLCVFILLPLEVASGYLEKMTGAIVLTINPRTDTDNPQFLKVLTKPLTNAIVQIDKKVIEAIAQNRTDRKRPLLKLWCKESNTAYNETFTPIYNINQTFVNIIDGELWTKDFKYDHNNETNSTMFLWKDVNADKSTKCGYLFSGQGLPGSALIEPAVGVILLFASLIILIVCLILLVKTLHSLLKGPFANVIRKTINAEFPGYFAFLTGYVAILVGAGMTVLVQSSSVFTSTLTPLVGMGVVSLERMYPLTLGSNIGTTITGMLAALTASPDHIRDSLQVAFCHLFFNISGVLLFYPIPILRRIPIKLAKGLGNTTAEYRWFAILYLIMLFLLLPMLVFALSLAGWYVLLGVGLPFVLLFVVVIIVNVIQSQCPKCLPKKLQDWEFLPKWLHSLEPYDNVFSYCRCCKKQRVSTNECDSIPNSTAAVISNGKAEPSAYGNNGFTHDV